MHRKKETMGFILFAVQELSPLSDAIRPEIGIKTVLGIKTAN